MAISITRLSGGNTPADGSDPRTFPAIWNATATTLEANVGEGGGSITVSPTAPTDPVPASGDLWWNSTEGELYVYYNDGTSSQWVAAAGPSVTVAATAPTGYEGQLWLDSTDGSMYVYYTDPGGGSSSWIGAVSRSGGILQVVSATKTDLFTSSSTSFVDITGLSVSITPRSTSSKIYALVTMNVSNSGNVSDTYQLVRDSTPLGNSTAGSTYNGFYSANTYSFGASGNHLIPISFAHLDSPGSTSTLTYKVQGKVSGSTLYVNRPGANAAYGGSSSITILEVAG